MKILLQNTSHGLIPIYDSDFDEKKKLKIGEFYTCEVKKKRNLQFHRLYFALINCSWEYLSEARQNFFKNDKTNFRKCLEVSAGHCDTVYNAHLKQWVDIPKSISFDKMDELEFRDLYESIKNVLFTVFLNHITIEEFESNLINF